MKKSKMSINTSSLIKNVLYKFFNGSYPLKAWIEDNTGDDDKVNYFISVKTNDGKVHFIFLSYGNDKISCDITASFTDILNEYDTTENNGES